jgi:D-alanyl-D-alanine carboxypeptidase
VLLLLAGLLGLAAPAVASSHVIGTDRGDRLLGTGGRDWLEGRQGDDLVAGLTGNDVLGGDDGKEAVRGGPGHDEMYGGRGADRMTGGPGNDSLNGDRGRDELRGGPGNDFLADYDDGDLLLAGAGNDRSSLASGDPVAHGMTRLHLGPGADEVTVQDDASRDLIDCGPGQDLAEWITTLDPSDVYVGCEVVREYLGY